MRTTRSPGGLLSGKHSDFDSPGEGGRFARFNGYLDRYWKPEYFDAIQEFVKRCEAHDIAPAAAALVHHSALAGAGTRTGSTGSEATDSTGGRHGIILGASSESHYLSQTLSACDEGPLPEEVLATLDRV